MYSNNMADYHLIMDLLPSLARLYFLNMMGDIHFSAAQSVKYFNGLLIILYYILYYIKYYFYYTIFISDIIFPINNIAL